MIKALGDAENSLHQPVVPAPAGRTPVTRPKRRHFSSTADWLRWRRFRFLGKLVNKNILKCKRPVEMPHPNAPGRLFLRPGTADFGIFWEIFLDRLYDSLLRREPGRSVSAVRTIVDLGANCGMFTRFALAHFPNARILAVEPDAANLAVCRRNVEASGRPEAVTLVQACAAARAGYRALDRQGRSTASYEMVAATTAAEQIRAATVPELLQQAGFEAGIDIFKCDIEGAEREIFADCRNWIDRVGCLTIELHPPYTLDDFERDLTENGAQLAVVERVDNGQLASAMLTLGKITA